VALRIMRDRSRAEDVVVEVYWQVWRDAARFDRARGEPLGWLLTICRSRALDALRRRDPASQPGNLELSALPDEASEDEPAAILESLQEQHRMRNALQFLKPVQQKLVGLAFFNGLTHQEIATHTGLPLGTVKTHIRTALLVMRQALQENS
jgi:RNA polymerase sigma-70 factor (ECF subfamily)